jgi:hypothetical protein
MAVSVAIVLVLVPLMMFCDVCEHELHGTYVARYASGTATLILSRYSEYTQIVKINGQADSVVHYGRWYLKDEPLLLGSDLVCLDSALFVATFFWDGLLSDHDWPDELLSDYDLPTEGRVILGVNRFLPWSTILLGSPESVVFTRLPSEDAG